MSCASVPLDSVCPIGDTIYVRNRVTHEEATTAMSVKRSPAASTPPRDALYCRNVGHDYFQLTHWSLGQQTIGAGLGQAIYGQAKLVCKKCGKVIAV